MILDNQKKPGKNQALICHNYPQFLTFLLRRMGLILACYHDSIHLFDVNKKLKRLAKMNKRDWRKMCMELLEKTNQGNDLSPPHLNLLGTVMNGFACSSEEDELKKIYEQVIEGSYTPPYFHGIEHMTQDHQGNISFKGIFVGYMYRIESYTEEAKKEVQALQQWCLKLEKENRPINSVTASFHKRLSRKPTHKNCKPHKEREHD